MRLFIAVDPSPEVNARIERAIALLRPGSPSSRWVAAASLHVTLAFLGDINDAMVGSYAAAVTNVAGQHARFRLHFKGGGSFGSTRKPRILWAGIEGESDALAALQRDMVAAIVPLGHTPEPRGFSPHLTLARARDPGGDEALAAAAAAVASQDFGDATIAQIILYRSDLAREGARYTKVAEAMLGQKAV